MKCYVILFQLSKQVCKEKSLRSKMYCCFLDVTKLIPQTNEHRVPNDPAGGNGTS